MADTGRTSGLQTIFSFFLGLMVTAFVGVGAYTFHPPPQTEFDGQIEELNRREEAVRDSKSPDELTADDRDELRTIREERNELSDASRVALEGWGRSTSIVLIVLATLVMAISLLRSDQLPVISNGLLMGGVFTMVYGVGWIVATDTSVARFFVMTVALAITIALGYVRFVRGRAKSIQSVGVPVTDGREIPALEQRVRDLEDRMNAASRALGQEAERPPEG
jgi:hypothetical protein